MGAYRLVLTNYKDNNLGWQSIAIVLKGTTARKPLAGGWWVRWGIGRKLFADSARSVSVSGVVQRGFG